MHIRFLRRHRGRLAAAAAAALLPVALIGAGTASAASAAHQAFAPPAIKHVWVIDLENEGYAQSFGDPSANPYLATTLPSMGALLKNYAATARPAAARRQASRHRTRTWPSPA